MLKSKIRKKILKIRQSKNNGKITINFNRVYDLLKRTTNLKKKIIGGYYPVNYEVDDLEILKKFKKKRIKVALPAIKKNFQMNFIRFELDKPLIINQYGIPEPSEKKIVYPDILQIPLVAFDKKLNRLGYGAGFYDRYISSLKKVKKIVLIGLAFNFQQVNSIPVSKYDQKLDYIITNKRILTKKLKAILKS